MLARTRNGHQILLLLQHLDRLLEIALNAAQTPEEDTANYSHEDIRITEAVAQRFLAQEPAKPLLHSGTLPKLSVDAVVADSPLGWLQRTFGLSEFDLDVIVLALAPEFDRRYERLYAYLQDDVRCKRPTVDLCLNLLCSSAVEKLSRRSHFTAQSPLVQQGLLHLIPDPNQSDLSLLAHAIKLDPQVIHLLLQIKGLDERLSSCCEWIMPKIRFQDLPFSPFISQALPALLQAEWTSKQPVKLYFHGVDRAGKRRVAEAIAHVLNVPLIRVNVTQLVLLKSEFVPTLRVLLREAIFQNGLLYFEGLEALQTPDQEACYQSFIHALTSHDKIVILADDRADLNHLQLEKVLSVTFAMPDLEQRKWYWSRALEAAGLSLSAADLTMLSDRLKLTADQIDNAVATVHYQNLWQGAETKTQTTPGQLGSASQTSFITDLFAAARQVSSQHLGGLCQQIQPRYRWDDLVLPAAQKRLLQEICNQIRYQDLVQKSWGFDRKHFSSKGLSVLFSGPPGTGKTMAAEVIAQELQLDLYKIDLSQIVSKYIGETEKNLNQIFTSANNINAILLFDEADALFGKRTEIKDAHDRYANLEISYLLQKMEEYEGLAILTTNLRSNMDEAFVRRLRFIIEFPFPSEKQRQQIWQQAFPSLAPCSSTLDFTFLADNFELSGAAIRNIVLASAFLAAAEDQPIGMNYITQAIRREYQKMGKIPALPSKATSTQ